MTYLHECPRKLSSYRLTVQKYISGCMQKHGWTVIPNKQKKMKREQRKRTETFYKSVVHGVELKKLHRLYSTQCMRGYNTFLYCEVEA